VRGLNQADSFSRLVRAPDHAVAVAALMDWIEERGGRHTLTAVGHRVVHGGPRYCKPERITPQMVEELHRLSPFDPDHLPEEILLTEAFHHRFPELPQVACFDTAFHHDLRAWPSCCRSRAGTRRKECAATASMGCPYAFLMGELARLAGPESHKAGSSLPTSQWRQPGGGPRWQTRGHKHELHPTAGVPMSTRSGDLDPDWCGIWRALRRWARSSSMRWSTSNPGCSGFGNQLGMRDLLGREAQDVRAAEAVALFCYQTKKWIGSFAAAMGGLDTLVFAGGIGEMRIQSVPGFAMVLHFLESNSKSSTTRR